MSKRVSSGVVIGSPIKKKSKKDLNNGVAKISHKRKSIVLGDIQDNVEVKLSKVSVEKLKRTLGWLLPYIC